MVVKDGNNQLFSSILQCLIENKTVRAKNPYIRYMAPSTSNMAASAVKKDLDLIDTIF